MPSEKTVWVVRGIMGIALAALMALKVSDEKSLEVELMDRRVRYCEMNEWNKLTWKGSWIYT